MSKTLQVSLVSGAKAFRLIDGESDYRIVPFAGIKGFRVVSARQEQWEIQALLDNDVWESFGQYPQRQDALNQVTEYAAAVWK